MNLLLVPIVVSLALGTFCFLVPRKIKGVREFVSVVGSLAVFALVFWIFRTKPLEWTFGNATMFVVDNLSAFVLLGTGFFGFFVSLFSVRFMRDNPSNRLYYSCFLWTLGASLGAVMANHLLVLLTFWGFLGITLYLMVLTGGGEASTAAKKTLVIVGGSDAFMLLGIGLIHTLTNTFEMDKMFLSLETPLAVVAFFSLLIGAFAKAGSMPLHTWIPEVAEKAPIPVTAYLPAALDKLLGIYLLGRMCLHVFETNVTINLVLMALGSVTIIAAVMMALVQHDLRRLLAFHAVSQVGYMVVGIGTGTPIGIAGGLFHMLNNSIYKTCLFLCGGAVQHRIGTSDLDRLGGLAKAMPVTFAGFMVAALSISGIPPFNGFVSKWMVYQGLIELGQTGDRLWVVWLVAAMFGSGLTLASFMKITHTVFLGVPSALVAQKKIREAGVGMLVPILAMALLCIVFGLFPNSIPMAHFLIPAVPGFTYLGLWTPGLATGMILLGLAIGLVFYGIGNIKKLREMDSFVGGEKIPVEERVSGTSFYNTIRELGGLRKLYAWGEAKKFDIYEQLASVSFWISDGFRKIHSGILNEYMLWVYVGFLILVVVLLGI